MIKKYPFLFLGVLLAAILAAGLLVRPILALAEGEEPTAEQTPPTGETPLAEEPAPTENLPEDVPAFEDETPLPEESPPEDLQPEVSPTEDAPAEVTPTDEMITETPTEEPPSEATPTAEPSGEEPMPTGETEPETTGQPDPSGEEAPGQEVFAEETSPDAEIPAGTLPDSTGLLSTQPEEDSAASEVPAAEDHSEEAYSGSDPYIDRSDGRYHFLPLGGCDAYGGVSAYCIESTTPLQAAVNAAYDGEVINVEAGTYTEQVEIVDITLTLRGWGNPIIAAPGLMTASGSIYALIYASNAHLNLEGFTIDASNADDGDALTDNSIYGIYYHNSSGQIANNTIMSNAATDDETYGVYLETSGGETEQVTVTNNTISDHNQAGVYSQGSNLQATITNNQINTSAPADNDSTAIYVAGSQENTISGNTIDGNHDQGIHLYFSDNNTISANTIRNTSQNGILLTNSSGNRVILNVITQVNDDSDSSAIRLEENSDNNTITKNTLSGNSIAVQVLNGSDSTTISENRISGNEVGVQVAADAGKDEPANTAIYWNILTGNTTAVANLTSTTLYAALNWWGCPEGPPACGVVTGPVDTVSPLPFNPDPDYDMVFSSQDNCPFIYNPAQLDSNANGIGDACDENVKTYKVEAVENEEDIKTFSFTLDEKYDAMEIVLIETLKDLSEHELARVLYPQDAAPDGILVSFEQVLAETLPKPFEDDVQYLGPAFTLRATAKDGSRMDELAEDMTLSWMLAEDYEAPEGTRLAVYYFDTDTFYWITEAWQEIEFELDETENTINVQTPVQGTYALVLLTES